MDISLTPSAFPVFQSATRVYDPPRSQVPKAMKLPLKVFRYLLARLSLNTRVSVLIRPRVRKDFHVRWDFACWYTGTADNAKHDLSALAGRLLPRVTF